MIGKRFPCPPEVCESQLIQVVGSEWNDKVNPRLPRVEGDTIFWCCEVMNDRPKGTCFAVGSSEISSWKKNASNDDTANARDELLRNARG